MPYIDECAGEIHIKIVYHGPSLSGRTTNLQYVYNKTRPEAKGRFNSVATETVRDLGGNIVTVTTILCCEIIPLSIAPIRGYRLRLCLFTTPGALYIEGNMERAPHGADGVVFVTDSRRARHDTAIESMGALATYVARQGRSLASVPLVLQYNMRDLPDILPVAELDAVLNPGGRPSFEAVAPMGQGVFETLKADRRKRARLALSYRGSRERDSAPRRHPKSAQFIRSAGVRAQRPTPPPMSMQVASVQSAWAAAPTSRTVDAST